jgi:hypothetical protein
LTMRLIAAGSALFAIMSVHGVALARDEAAAETLFLEAKRLAAAGKFAAACPKFAESNRLDRGAGTLIHLANCYEKNKQSASAWATFKEAASASQALGRADWQKLATQRASALEPKLAKLTVRVERPADRMMVTRDGSEASPASWGTAIPVDVGSHTIEATAPGRQPFRSVVTIAKDGDGVDVVIPQLDVIPAPPVALAERRTPAPVPPAADAPPRSPNHTMAYVVGGIGVAGLAVGVASGILANAKNNDSKALCPNDGPCGSADAVSANESARTLGLVSTVAFVAGGAALLGGIVLFATAPSRSANVHALRLVPFATGQDFRVTLRAAF